MTKNELWNRLFDFYLKNERCPQPEELATECKLSVNAIKQVYESWRLEQKLDYVKPFNSSVFYYDIYDKTVKEELLKRLPKNSVRNAPRIAYDEPNGVKEYKETTKPKIPLNFDVFKGVWLKLFALIVSVILLTCSIHFTFDFNHKAMNLFWAMMMSLAICGFNGFAFSISDSMKGFSKYVVICMWFVGTFFSIFTAIGTQYNNFVETKSKDTSVAIDNQKQIIEKQIAQLQKKADLLYTFREQEIEYNENPDLKIENRGTWRVITERVSELNGIENSMIELENRLIDIGEVESENVANKTVYSWLEDITHKSADFWQFLVMCFPAVFIDLTVSVLIKFVFSKNENKSKKKGAK